jgi:hypothetical protein
MASHSNCVNRFVREERPGATVHDLEALKHFVYWQAAAVDGTKGLQACVETVRNYWNRFTAGWKRKHKAIQKDIAESVTNVSVKPTLFRTRKLILRSTFTVI